MGIVNDAFLKKIHDIDCINETPPFPKSIKITISGSCNYGCIFCNKARQKNLFGNIDHALCYRVLSEAYKAGTRKCCLSGYTEPLLNRYLEDYITFAKKLGYEYVFINTNGYLMMPERGRALLDAGIDSIKFSINSSQKSYDLVHGTMGGGGGMIEL